jgi:hypothetical protein
VRWIAICDDINTCDEGLEMRLMVEAFGTDARLCFAGVYLLIRRRTPPRHTDDDRLDTCIPTTRAYNMDT